MQVYGSADADIKAGVAGAAADAKWGQIDSVSSWGGIGGSVTADHGGPVMGGGPIAATVTYATPPTVSASNVAVRGEYPADPQVSLAAAQAALRQATGEVVGMATALTESRVGASNAAQAAEAQLDTSRQQSNDLVTQGMSAATAALGQSSRTVTLLLAQDQAQGKGAISSAAVQVGQGIAKAQGAAAEQKLLLQQAMQDSGRQIAADEARLAQQASLERSDASTLLSAQQAQRALSAWSLSAEAATWPGRFDAEAEAEFSQYCKDLWAATAKLREKIHDVLTGTSVVASFFGPVGIVVGRLADAANAGLYLAEGNYLQAGLCSLTFVPFGHLFSGAAEGSRVADGLGAEAGQAFRLGEDAGEAVNLARTAEQDGGAVDALLSKEASAAKAGKSEIQAAEEGEAAALSKCSDGGGCFAAGTHVETGSGSEEPIEDVRVGDSVMSRDQFDPSAPAQPGTVTAVYTHTVYDLRDVTVVSADGSREVIRATGEHPFYVQGVGWVAAAQLLPGETLKGPDGSAARVAGNVDEPHPEGVSVYNFQVTSGHTYFVSQGGTPVWVHNTYYTSPDPGVAHAANAIEFWYPGHVVSVNRKIINPVTGLVDAEFDIELRNAVIQVKSAGARASDIAHQVATTVRNTPNPVIVYGPLKDYVVRRLRNRGILVVTDLSDLLKVVAP